MAPGPRLRVDQATAERFAAAVHEATEQAGAGIWATSTFDLGPVAMRLRCTDPVVADAISKAMGHRLSDQTVPMRVDPELVVSVWDTTATGVALPRPQWDWQAHRYDADGLVFTYDSVGRRFTMTDVAAGRAVYWLTSSAALPSWEAAAPLRDLLHRLLDPRGCTFVHAGALGDGVRCVLLAGPGGSGKSTTVVAGARRGLATLGDDYLVLDPDGRTVHSLYATLRLLPDSPVFDPSMPAVVATDGKSNLLLGDVAGAALSRSMTVVAVLAPHVGGPRTTLRPIRPVEALRALAPTSLVQLDPTADALARLRELVTAVPSYELELGAELDEVAAVIRGLLAEHAGPGSPRPSGTGEVGA